MCGGDSGLIVCILRVYSANDNVIKCLMFMQLNEQIIYIFSSEI